MTLTSYLGSFRPIMTQCKGPMKPLWSQQTEPLVDNVHFINCRESDQQYYLIACASGRCMIWRLLEQISLGANPGQQTMRSDHCKIL